MRVLGLETSSRRGSVALVEGGRVVAERAVDAPGGHAERLLDVVEGAFADAGWARSAVDRLAVGTGPGSFTGVRVGIALGQGIALGLDRPIVGVSSLAAMCGAVPADLPGVRAALLDARRSDLFAATYGAAGEELAAPALVARADVAGWLACAGAAVVVGEVLAELAPLAGAHRSDATDLPHAAAVALLGARIEVGAGFPEATYVRPADAIRPNLPPSPLRSREPR